MNTSDPYMVLGLEYGATRTQIKAAWRAAIKVLHPDANPDDPDAPEKFAAVQEAYTQLINSVREVKQHVVSDDIPKHDPFAYLAGPSRPGQDLQVSAHVDLTGALNGVVVKLLLEYPVPAEGGVEVTHRCYLDTKIAPGTPEGTVLTLARRGTPGWGGGIPGDLLVTVRVDQDPVWVARGRDTYAQLDVTSAAGIGGAHLVIPHPRGSVNVDVPAGTTDSVEVTFPGAGIGGDGHVRVRVVPLDMGNPEVAYALRALDQAQQAQLRAEA